MAYVVVQKPVPETPVLKVIAKDLVSRFADDQILAAITRVMRECEWITLKAITDRIPGTGADDGRPDVETAWAMCPKTEERSVVWTEEMSFAFDIARRLLMDGDHIAARMAFREAYAAEVQRARRENRPAVWSVSLGENKADRVRALAEGVIKRRITAKHAKSMLWGEQLDELLVALPDADRKLIAGEVQPIDTARLSEFQTSLKRMAESKLLPSFVDAEKKPAAPEQTEEEKADHVRRVREQAASLRRPVEPEDSGVGA